MSLVAFNISGTILTQAPQIGTISGTNLIIVDPLVHRIVYSGYSSSGIHNYTIQDVTNISLDNYLIATSAFGYLGSAEIKSGLSATEEVFNEDFQSITPTTSGEVLYYNNFEDSSLSGIVVTYTGTAPTSSGIFTSSNMVGTKYFRLQATSSCTMMLDPSDAITSGIPCGRVILLARNSTDSSSSNKHVGVAFLRQSPALSGEGLKYFFDTENFGGTTSTYSIRSYAGAISSAGSLTSAGSSVNQTTRIDFDSASTKNSLRRQWLVIEWEAVTSGTFINVFYKPYQDGDTVSNITSSLVTASQTFYTGFTDGARLYTSTSLPPAILLNSNSSTEMGVDEMQIESLSSIDRKGIFRFNTLGVTSGTGSRPYIQNRATNSSLFIPHLGSAGINVPNNPYISKERSSSGITGYGGLEGMGHFSNAGSTGHVTTTLLSIPEVSASGIIHGSIRAMVKVTDITAQGKVGFTVMRQGNLFSSNGYTVELFYNSAYDYRIRLRKGQPYSDPNNNSADFQGTILATSSNLNWASSYIAGWVDFRWKVEGSSVKLEVYFTKQIGEYPDTDTSPGNVDYNLQSILTYTDNSSPYLTTSESPMIILRSIRNNVDTKLYKLELRRARF